jgi:hypothetical protein
MQPARLARQDAHEHLGASARQLRVARLAQNTSGRRGARVHTSTRVGTDARSYRRAT